MAIGWQILCYSDYNLFQMTVSRVFHVLFVDSYDSFTYNVVRLIEQQKVDGYDEIKVVIIHNDKFGDVSELLKYVVLFDCIVVGPGPGNPINGAKDVGIIDSLFCDELREVPIFGICLGFQSMCYSHSALVNELQTIKHGQVYDIHLKQDFSDDLFMGHPATFKSTRYHSLHVSKINDKVIPLASTTDENGEILMSAKIEGRPWYGVQYHPESCCSEFGDLLIRNFIKIANKSNINKKRQQTKTKFMKENEELYLSYITALDKSIDRSPISNINCNGNNTEHQESDCDESSGLKLQEFSVPKDPKITLKLSDLIEDAKFIMASSTINANRGEWSIIAFPNENSTVFTHYDQLHKTTVHKWRDPSLTTNVLNKALHNDIKNSSIEVIKEDKSHFWNTIGDFMKPKIDNIHSDIPFIGGLVGILGYEMGYFVYNKINPQERLIPDAKLVFIENSIVIDHRTGSLYAISLNNKFPKNILAIIEDISNSKDDSICDIRWNKELPKDVKFDITIPKKSDYADAFAKCQQYMHKGDSYEMCLTTQTKIVPSKRIDPWRIFQTLVQRNPAPFSSYFKFDDIIDDNQDNVLCLLSTSPERFIKWDNETCELRPIKGTVKKGSDMTLDKATEILKTPKEFGENMMILDLIRNDLYELLHDVRVEEFMSVEEYETVYQLVSVVKGYGITKPSPSGAIYSGLDVFKHSLPAGSMTGAPKKITVEMLQNEIEQDLNPHVNGGVRGVYSGVTGYWSVNNNGDWSVNIRCMYSYNNGNSWQIGAGGAITVLSSLEGELDEMYIKLHSALQVFD
ncbi:hypothetical protein Kpol_1028p38 [Vanderwaltozyma polyspora DSM 70294]|uniref:aminodeoxychorismate synthase n=1 Tax=Vanderwaltozyma polyspora (strain ATCC 22028 / DSM 70294 / BCRC 21397 / CBS 2163 / NBRC 10782 / NRRL Y-8283 / UCD 57-17) TaxID=436907 RepID=A7TG08_VANPO|nr:uncharacterized protein Kpol_1028p38 [Vanderwaltozyma polyspora DSM 70294]EDO18765.1 hypothetical protein Kpol_1028p38 [Vanderwaltozyma polyspora DSM 70294]